MINTSSTNSAVNPQSSGSSTDGAPRFVPPGVRPATAPHTDVSSLSDSLAQKIRSASPDTVGTPATGGSGSGNGGSAGTSSNTQTPSFSSKMPSRKMPLRTVVAAVLLVLAVVGAGATYYLSTQSGDNRNRAAESYATYCSTHDGKNDSGQSCSGMSESQCASNAGSGCGWTGRFCFCGTGSTTIGGADIRATSCGASPTICNYGTSAAPVQVSLCREENYQGNECRIGCGSQTYNVGAATGPNQPTCINPGLTKPQCGRWQVDVKFNGAVLCSDFSCETGSCGTPTTPPPTTPPPASTPPTAQITMGAATCGVDTGKYEVNKPINFAVTATSGTPAATESRVFIAKVDAAGTGLAVQGAENTPCLNGAGVISGPKGFWCKIATNQIPASNYSGTVTWNAPMAGKYVVTTNAIVPNGTSCTGNPTCDFNGSDSPFTKSSCTGFVNCSNNDWHMFEVVTAELCKVAGPQLVINGCVRPDGTPSTQNLITLTWSNTPTKVQVINISTDTGMPAGALRWDASPQNVAKAYFWNKDVRAYTGTSINVLQGGLVGYGYAANKPIPVAPGKYYAYVWDGKTAAQAQAVVAACPADTVIPCGKSYSGPGYKCATGLQPVPGQHATMFCSKPEYVTACATAINPATSPTGTISQTQIDAACCSAPVTPPPTTPPPTAGPMCLRITAAKEDGTPLTAGTNLTIGTRVRFTCAQVAGVTTYGFRIKENGAESTLEKVTGTTSKLYTVNKPGSFIGQCTICPSGTCYPFDATSTGSTNTGGGGNPGTGNDPGGPITGPSCQSFIGSTCARNCPVNMNQNSAAIGCDTGLHCCVPASSSTQ